MPTDNHDLATPGKGETDWDEPINANTTELDRKVEIRDTDANRSDYTPKDGAKFTATDTGEVWLGDGEAWTYLGVIGRDGAVAATKTASGDGAATSFTLSHSLDAAPSQVVATATTADAVGDFHVANKTESAVDIVYATAPADGTDNLSWDIALYE